MFVGDVIQENAALEADAEIAFLAQVLVIVLQTQSHVIANTKQHQPNHKPNPYQYIANIFICNHRHEKHPPSYQFASPLPP